MTIDSIEIEQKLYDGILCENPEALGELATMLQKIGYEGHIGLRRSYGYGKLKPICELEI